MLPSISRAWIIEPGNQDKCISRYAQQDNNEVASLSIRLCYLYFEATNKDKKWIECSLEKNKSVKTEAVAKINISICQKR